MKQYLRNVSAGSSTTQLIEECDEIKGFVAGEFCDDLVKEVEKERVVLVASKAKMEELTRNVSPHNKMKGIAN